MRILRGLTSIAMLSAGRNYRGLLEKARRLRGIDQTPAALACLREGLVEENANEGDREDPDYPACHVLMAECEVECGLLRGDVVAVRAGLEQLLRVETRFADYLTLHPTVWREVVGMADRGLVTVLGRDWRPGSDKTVFRNVVGRLARAWVGLRELASAVLICESGAEAFPGDPHVLFWQAEVAVAQGDLTRSLALMHDSLAAGPNPATAPEVVALMDRVARLGSGETAGLAEALKGEALRRAGRWDEAFTALTHAEELTAGSLPDFAIEALLLAALRRNDLDAAERFGARYGPGGFGRRQMNAVASAVRSALDRAPERKHLWLFWSQLCLHLGRLGESLQGVARTLGLDPSLAEGVLAGCRSLPARSVETPTFRLGLARVMLASGDLQHTVEALRWFDSAAVGAEDLQMATHLCRELIGRDSSCLPGRSLLVRLLLRQNALDEALANGQTVFELSGDAEEAAALSWRVGGASKVVLDAEAGVAAREFEVDVWLKANDPEAALEAIEVLCAQPTATKLVLGWARERLRDLTLAGAGGLRVRLVTGNVLRRLGAAPLAAAEYLEILRGDAPPEVLERACYALREILECLPEPGPARAALAAGWLRLGWTSVAREPLLTCLGSRRPESSSLLELLRSRLLQHTASLDWFELAVAAAHATGDASLLRGWLERFEPLAESSPADLDRLRSLLGQIDRALLDSNTQPGLTRLEALLAAASPNPPAAGIDPTPPPATPAPDPVPVSVPAEATQSPRHEAPVADVPAAPRATPVSRQPEPRATPAPAARAFGNTRALREALARETVDLGGPCPARPTPRPATGSEANRVVNVPKGSLRDRLRQQTVEFVPLTDRPGSHVEAIRRTASAPSPAPAPDPADPSQAQVPNEIPALRPVTATEAQRDALVEEAFAAYRKKDYPNAKQLFERALEIDPTDRRAKYNASLLTRKLAAPPSPRPPAA